MARWRDPDFGEALLGANLIAVGTVLTANRKSTWLMLEVVFWGNEAPETEIEVQRAPLTGIEQRNHRLPAGSRLLVLLDRNSNGYIARTDSYWAFGLSHKDSRVHMPVRDPFTRSYIPLVEFAELVHLLRSPAPEASQRLGCLLGLLKLFRKPSARQQYLTRRVESLGQTTVRTEEPMAIHKQLLVLETLYLLGHAGEHLDAILPFLMSPHYQVRWSTVRALSSCGPGSTRVRNALLDLLEGEDVPVVQTALGEALFSLLEDDSTRARIELSMEWVGADPIPLAPAPTSPIRNTIASPQLTLSAILLKLDGQEGDLATLRALAAHEASPSPP